MCEFCHKHGEGKKWYLRAQNYSEDLLSDIKRARFIEDFFAHPEKIAKGDLKAEDLMKAPERVRKIMGKMITRSSMKEHFGQVVPIEDIKKILDITTSIVRLECICRRTSVGPEQRFCYGLSLMPRGGRLVEIVNRIDPAYLKGPNDSDLEIMSREKTLSVFME